MTDSDAMMSSGGKWMWRRGLAALAVLAIAASAIVGSAAPAAAQEDDGLRMVVETIYRVRPDDGVVEVEINYSVTNQVPDRRQGFQILQTFFRSIPEIVPNGATDLTAWRANGTELTITEAEIPAEVAAEIEESPFDFWDIDLGPNLFFGQTRELTVSYRLPDGEARSLEAWARVNPAIASFPVFARGDAGLSSVLVEFPPGFEVDSFGSPLESTNVFGSTVWSAKDIEDPASWFTLFIGFAEGGLDRRPIEVAAIDGNLTIASWPGDAEWESFVKKGLIDGIPILEEVVGVEWPVNGELEIIETVAPALAGYGGWYYEPQGSAGDDATIEVGEELLLDLLLHEVAHAWFNRDFTRMRWLNEGLAEHFAILVANGLASESVEEFPEVTADDEAFIDLLEWGDPVFDQEEDPIEAFAYSASFQLVDVLADEIGEEAMAATIALLWRGANPYRETLDDPGPDHVDWRDALDAFEITGGSTSVENLFVEWVLGDDEEETLAPRSHSRQGLDDLLGREPAWSVPDVVPALLADWKFEVVDGLYADMNSVLDHAARLIDDAATRGLLVPDGPQSLYESVDSAVDGFEGVQDALDEQQGALDRVLRAHDRAEEPVAFFDSIGLYRVDVDAEVVLADAAFEAGDYEEAIAAADQVDSLLDGAESLGKRRVVIAGSSVVGALTLLTLVWFLWRRRRKRKMAEAEPKEFPAAVSH